MKQFFEQPLKVSDRIPTLTQQHAFSFKLHKHDCAPICDFQNLGVIRHSFFRIWRPSECRLKWRMTPLTKQFAKMLQELRAYFTPVIDLRGLSETMCTCTYGFRKRKKERKKEISFNLFPNLISPLLPNSNKIQNSNRILRVGTLD